MSKKRLDSDSIMNELSGKSVFFQKDDTPALITKLPGEHKTTDQSSKDDTVTPRNRDTTQPRNHDTVIPRYHDTMVELIRKAVKIFGKEAATHRFTEDEKRAISDIVFSYKQQDIRTSENEIARIAINYVLEDYRENGENSILHLALKALNQ